MIPLLGSRRVFFIDGLEAEQLSDTQCRALCAVLEDPPEDVCIILSAQSGTFDPKKGARAKKIQASADKGGLAICLGRRKPAELRTALRARCRKQGCELPVQTASFLIETCGEDLGVLFSECDKLCAYGRSPIDEQCVRLLCAPAADGDLYALGRLLIAGKINGLFSQMDSLLRMRQPVALLLSNLGTFFCDLYRAAAAREAAKQASDMAEDLHYRFPWQAKNAFRDSARLDPQVIYSICRIFYSAELALKSGVADERALLESAAVRAFAALRGEALC
jgi:DNA polymerase-3 subunit delta